MSIRNKLEKLSLTQAWSLRETDLWDFQRQLDRIDEVWQHIDRPPDAHELTCDQCRAARASLQTLRSVTARHRSLEETAGTDPDESLRPRARVRENVLAVARAEVRRGRRIPATVTEIGPVLVSEQALVSLVRLAADSVPGVRARRIDITPRRRLDETLAARKPVIAWNTPAPDAPKISGRNEVGGQ